MTQREKVRDCQVWLALTSLPRLHIRRAIRWTVPMGDPAKESKVVSTTTRRKAVQVRVLRSPLK